MASSGNLVLNLLITAKDQASAAFGKLFESLNDSTNVLATRFRAAFSDLFGGSVRGAAEFEAQLSKVQAKGDESYRDIGKLKSGLADLAAQFGITGKDAAEGMEVLAAAGLSAEDALKALPAVLNLAKTEGLSLDAAATKLSDSLSIVGLGFDQAGKMADVLAKGANLSTASASSLAEALSVAGGIAKSAGLDLERTVAALDLLHAAGIKGSAAGTALAAILTQLQNPASAASKELSALGISSRSLGEVIEGLSAKGVAADKAILAFGETAGPGLRALIEQGNAKLVDFTAQLRDSGGAAQESADRVGLNLNTALSGLAAVWENVKAALAEPVLQPLAAAAKEVAAALNDALKNGALVPLQAAIKKFATEGIAAVRDFVLAFDFKAALTALGAFVAQAETYFGAVKTAGAAAADTVKTAWNAAQTAFYSVATAVSAVATGFTATVAAWADALNAVGLASNETRTKVENALEAMKRRTRELAEAAKANAGETGDAFDRLAKSVDSLGPALDKLKGKLPTGELKGLVAEVDAYAEALKNAKPGTDEAAYYAERLRLAQEGLTRAQRDGTTAATAADAAVRKSAEAAKTATPVVDGYRTVWQTVGVETPRLVEAQLNLAGGLAEVERSTRISGAGLTEWNGALVRSHSGVTVLSGELGKIKEHLTTTNDRIAEYDRQIRAATANAGGWSAGMEINNVKLLGLRDAVTATGEKLAYLKSIQAELPDANTKIADATTANTAAQNAYAAALEENVAQQERAVEATRRAGELESGALDLKRELVQAEKQIAEAKGDTTAATRAESEAVALQVEQLRAAAAAKDDEIAAYADLIDATERKLAADGTLDASDRARLLTMADTRAGMEQERDRLLQNADAAEALAAAKEKEAEAAKAAAEATKDSNDAIAQAEKSFKATAEDLNELNVAWAKFNDRVAIGFGEDGLRRYDAVIRDIRRSIEEANVWAERLGQEGMAAANENAENLAAALENSESYLNDAAEAAADNLRTALADAKQEAMELRGELADLASEYKKSILEETGNDMAVLLMERTEAIADIQEKYRKAGQMASAEYQEAIRLAEQYYDIKIRQQKLEDSDESARRMKEYRGAVEGAYEATSRLAEVNLSGLSSQLDGIYRSADSLAKTL